jgi:hypothetical protein
LRGAAPVMTLHGGIYFPHFLFLYFKILFGLQILGTSDYYTAHMVQIDLDCSCGKEDETKSGNTWAEGGSSGVESPYHLNGVLHKSF